MAERKGRSRPPRKAAAALRYRPEKDVAPRVTAAGRGALAERIIALARKHGVPIQEDSDLVELLAQLDIGEVIPYELYQVVAEVLAYVYRVNAAARAALTRPQPSSNRR